MANLSEGLKTSQSNRNKEQDYLLRIVMNELRQTRRNLVSEIATLGKNVEHNIKNQRRLNLVIPILLSVALLLSGMLLGRFLTHEYEINTYQKCHQVVASKENPKEFYCKIK